MEPQLCSVCKKRIATVFLSQMDQTGKTQNKGLCLLCAKKMGLPQVDQFLEKMGLSDEELDNFTEELDNMGKLMAESMDSTDSPAVVPDNSESRTNTPNFFDFFKRMGPGGMTPPDKTRAKNKDDKNKEERNGHMELKNLNLYSTDLNRKASEGKIDTVVGRDKEIERVIQILNRRTKNNPVLIGEAGVGKTAIAEALALKIINNDVPYGLLDSEIRLLDLTAMVAGTQFRGQFEARMKAVLDEVKRAGNIILVIDEVHNIMGAGEAEGSMNAANILKPALSRGEIQVIGATTLKEYRKFIEKDSALERRFQPVFVNEPSIEETIDILKGIQGHYAKYHKVRFTDSLLEDMVRMSERYITDRFLPDKAIDVMDETASRANLRNTVLPVLSNMRKELDKHIADVEEEQGREYKDEDDRLEAFRTIAEKKNRIAVLQTSIADLEKNEYVDVTFDDIARVIETWTGIPVQSVTEEEATRLIKLEDRLKSKIIGQDEGVAAVARAIRRNRSGFKKRYKPSSFVFVGPTGVGKTELVKQLTIELFGTADALIRLDMSEYMEKHTASKLIGSPPGYVGYDEAGQLTEKVRRRPYSVVLFDEIEKAHTDIFNMLLQILDDGRLTDNQGRTVNFENTIIIMTSNAGNSVKSKSIGFTNDRLLSLKDNAYDALKGIFRPEFMNRIDEIIVFDYLNKDSLKIIAGIMLKEIEGQCISKGLGFVTTDAFIEWLVDKSFDEQYGARPLRRTIQKEVEDVLSEKYLAGELKAGYTVLCDCKNGDVNIKIKKNEGGLINV